MVLSGRSESLLIPISEARSSVSHLPCKSAGKVKGKIGDSYEVAVKQLAAAQKNTGNALKSDGNAIESAVQNGGLSVGSNRLSISIGNKNYDFNINVTADDTNKSLQSKVAQAINKKGIGVTASLSTNSDGESVLSLDSKNTGTANCFEISGGNLVSALGLDNKTNTAANAVYTVNGGEEKESSSNTVSIKDGITTTLKKTTATGENVKISLNKDTGSIVDSVKNLVENYNSLLKEASELKDAGRSSLFRQLSGVASTYKSSLEKAGISVGKDGTLSINEERVKKAAEGNDLYRALGLSSTGSYSNYGFISKLEQVSGKASLKPESFLTQADNKAIQNSAKSKYDSTSLVKNNSYLSVKQINQMNQWMGQGTLFDTFF